MFPKPDKTYIPVATGPVVDAIDLVGTGVFSPEVDALIVEMYERRSGTAARYVQIVQPPDSPKSDGA